MAASSNPFPIPCRRKIFSTTNRPTVASCPDLDMVTIPARVPSSSMTSTSSPKVFSSVFLTQVLYIFSYIISGNITSFLYREYNPPARPVSLIPKIILRCDPSNRWCLYVRNRHGIGSSGGNDLSAQLFQYMLFRASRINKSVQETEISGSQAEQCICSLLKSERRENPGYTEAKKRSPTPVPCQMPACIFLLLAA